MDKLAELLKKKEKIEAKLAEIMPKLGHPHLDFIFEEIKLAESEA